MLDFIRGIVRPTVTWIGFGVVSIIALIEISETKKPPMWYVSLIGPMIGFWFGQRKQT